MEGETLQQKSMTGGSAAYAIPLAIVIAGIMIAGSILYSNGSPGTGPSGVAAAGQELPQPADIDFDELYDNDPSLGDPNAPVTIVEFSDFQCPFCRSFYTTTYQQLKEEYIDTGKVRIVFRDFPLSFHSAAQISALAAECANEQGRFWDFHDKVFDEQAKQGNGTIAYGEAELMQWASEVGIEGDAFSECLSSQRYAEEVEKDFAYGQTVGVSGTPSFYINDRLLIGAQPYAEFKALIEAAL